MLSAVFRYWLAPRSRVPATLGVTKNARKDTKTRSLCPPSGGDLMPPSAQNREAFFALLCAIKSFRLLAPWYCMHEIFSRHGMSRPPSGGDFVPPSCADRAHFLRFSVLQKALRYKKLEVRGLASADCSKPRSARPGSDDPRRLC